MALYSAKTWVDISSYCSWFVFRHRIPQGTGTFTEKLVYLGYLSLLMFMIFKFSCLGIKSRKSPGHSKTDVPLISIIGMNTKNICLHKYHFDILYWHVNFRDLIAIEEVWNITKRRFESLSNNKFSQLSPSVRRKQS